MKQTAHIYLFSLLFLFCACNRENKTNPLQPETVTVADSLEQTPPEEKPKAISAEQIEIVKDLLYDKYTLEDTYPYKDTTRSFQWDKIKERLALLENIQQEPSRWGILQNYKNRNGEAPLVRHYKRNAYKRIADTLGIERYQSVPLYLLTDTLVPERYGEDGSLVRFLADGEKFVKVSPIYIGEEWYVPKKYVKVLPDTTRFTKAIMIDRRDQNIATLEQTGEARWAVRSMNPATTGRPPAVCTGNPVRHLRIAGEKGTYDIPQRRFYRYRRLCTLRKPVLGRRIHSRSPGKRATQSTHRVQSVTGHHPPFAHVCTECHLTFEVYFRLGTCK